MRGLLVMTAVVFAGPAPGWETPSRGSAERGALMDAMRPHAEWVFGPPVVFVVSDLRVAGDVAFGAMRAVRPGGVEIQRSGLPRHTIEGDNPFDWDGPQLQVLYRRAGDTWVAVHHAIGATDVWYADPAFCPLWAPVIPEICAMLARDDEG